MKRGVLSLCILSAVTSLLCTGGGALAAVAGEHSKDPWWRHAVFYELYPRSFADADGNGMGDIAGITSKLDYLKSIGVGAIWITPCFPSPQVDFGYDISDYTAIAPEYGTMADFDKLLAEAKKRDIKICLDFVMNHTSDKHPWFIESKSSRTNPKRNWYIWKDAKAGGKSPNNWVALFGHSAWQWDKKTKQFYYHFFYPQQPDLNWRNKEVERAMFDSAAFWLKKGVAGFRLDAVNTMFESPLLEDNPVVAGKTNRFGDPETIPENNYLLPELHKSVQGLRAVIDTFPDDPVLIGETTDTKNIKEYAKWYGPNHDEIQLPMYFAMTHIDKLSPAEFRKAIGEADANPAGGQPVYLFSNHDIPRAYNRYGDGKNNDAIAKILATLLYTLRGTPILYYGEEIGMENNDPKRVEDVKDPIGKLGWPKEKGRDGERTPMQWTSGPNAGFSKAKPWLPVAANYPTHNVEEESRFKDSVLAFYRALAAVRSTSPALRTGLYKAINENDPEVLAYTRTQPNDATGVVVAINMSEKPKTIDLEVKSEFAEALIDSTQPTPVSPVRLRALKLQPYQVFIGKFHNPPPSAD